MAYYYKRDLGDGVTEYGSHVEGGEKVYYDEEDMEWEWAGQGGRAARGLARGVSEQVEGKNGLWYVEMERETYRERLDRANMRPQEATGRDAAPYTQFSSYHHHPPPHPQATLALSHSSDTLSNLNARTTLWWGDLEPWMDEEYVKQVCALMGWDNNSGNGDGVTVKIPQPPPEQQNSGSQPNNPGYCFLTFPTSQQAANVLAKLNAQQDRLPTMPNSSRPFNLNWATNLSPASTASAGQNMTSSATAKVSPTSGPREYSIFVGDLAPEASNSDLLAVFRNPILGLRSDRAPKVVKPFYSAKSAKIMLDPNTGISKGYGFVRFTEQAEQQRALMEMHGLYCLSRPMRVSPATAKFKPASPPVSAAIPGSDSFMSSVPSLSSSESRSFNVSFDSIPTPNRSVSTPLADAQKKQFAAQMDPRVDSPYAQINSSQSAAAFEESWNSPANAQARAILANLTGPNGEQLSSADPYNTTVFVGGLSPLISEETLRTFFAPFGDIHYVKVPAGKHCGFVQFVRKVDAQRAIDRMQGFPIGGSRIRLSWGRSQYKAAQAVVQQAQIHAQLQAQHVDQGGQPQHAAPPPVPSNQTTPKNMQTGPSITAHLTPQQALELLSRYGYQVPPNGQHHSTHPDQVPYSPPPQPYAPQPQPAYHGRGYSPQEIEQISAMAIAREQHNGHGSFSPFESQPPLNEVVASQSQLFNRAPGFGPSVSLPADLKITQQPQRSNQTASVASGSPRSASTHTVFSNGDQANYSHFYDGGSRAYHLNPADILRKDSHAMPRSVSNSSQRGGEQSEGMMPHSHSMTFTGGKAAEYHDVNGMLKNLSLDGSDDTFRSTEKIRHSHSKDLMSPSLPVDVD